MNDKDIVEWNGPVDLGDDWDLAMGGRALLQDMVDHAA